MDYEIIALATESLEEYTDFPQPTSNEDEEVPFFQGTSVQKIKNFLKTY